MIVFLTSTEKNMSFLYYLIFLSAPSAIILFKLSSILIWIKEDKSQIFFNHDSACNAWMSSKISYFFQMTVFFLGLTYRMILPAFFISKMLLVQLFNSHDLYLSIFLILSLSKFALFQETYYSNEGLNPHFLALPMLHFDLAWPVYLLY